MDMKIFSQNSEQQVIMDYFKGYRNGVLLSIGENNGETMSNCYAMVVNNYFGATLVEPSPKVFQQLVELHKERGNVYCVNVAVSDFNGKADFYDSGSHISHSDSSLLSSLDKNEIKRWGNSTTFDKIKVDVIDFKTLLNLSPYKTFDFISIDAEGNDLIILRQMNLTELQCKCLCIEYNSHPEILSEIRSICAGFGLVNELLINAENLLLSI